MSTEIELSDVPAPVTDALEMWGRALMLLHEPLRPQMLTDAWVAGLVAARVGAEHVTVKEWGPGKFPRHRKLPFVLQFPCPFGHRTEDKYDIATARLIVEDSGWWSLDPESPCPRCTASALRDWLLTCPRCEAGEDSDRHDPEHWALDVFDLDGDHDASPVAWVLREFGRLARVATARYWLDHPEEAAGNLPGVSEADRQRFIANQLARARVTLGAVPRKGASIAASKLSEGDVDAWLTDHGVPDDATVRSAWALVKDIEGRPAKNVIERILSERTKRRATVA